MSRSILHSLTALALAMISSSALAQDTPPYTEGAVSVVTAVRTQPGKFNEYFRYLSGPYSQVMDEAKKQGIITEYTFYAAFPRSPHDPDLYLVETYPNMAAFDSVTNKMTAISNKVFGSLQKADEADANREEIRKILGAEMVRELVPVKKGLKQ
ncbi:MAG TPA: hypothetical protein VHK24_00650 [Steroidobacter sp.]|nr:hypothetical protein [Steroidobacter sp.]